MATTGKRQVLRQTKHLGVQPRLTLGIVSLYLEVITIPKDVRVPARRLLGVVVATFHEMGRHLAGQARGRDDYSFRVPGQQLSVDARLRVEAFGVRRERKA